MRAVTPANESPSIDELIARVAKAGAARRERSAAVLVPLVERGGRVGIVLEVRSRTLSTQPGEVCLPGGGVEEGESARDCAIRETVEELLVSPEDISDVVALGTFSGPGGSPLHAFVGRLDNYRDTFSAEEVEEVFVMDVGWLIKNEPDVYRIAYEPTFGGDFPFELVPGGRGYGWRPIVADVPFFRGSDPLVWGVTARVLSAFSRALGEETPSSR